MKNGKRDDRNNILDSAKAALAKEERELREAYGIARNMACSEWTMGIIPSNGGGRYGLRPTKMIPERMDLLQKNFDMLLADIHRRRKELKAMMMKVDPERTKMFYALSDWQGVDPTIDHMILFHGTSAKFKNQIMKNGLRPRDLTGNSVYANDEVFDVKLESHPGLIYLTNTYAVPFAMLATRTYKGSLMVVAVDVDANDLLPDTDFNHVPSGWGCLRYSGTCCIRSERLQPTAIYILDTKTAYKIFPEIQIGTGLMHTALGPSFREQQDYVLMCARQKLIWRNNEWEKR